jgi:ATP-dependent Clp protease ATP-binding subunit ClpA
MTPSIPQLTSDHLIAFLVVLIGILLYYFSVLRKKAEGGGAPVATVRGSVLMTYTRDLSADAEAGKLDQVVGRDEEIDRVIHILARRSKNNPLLLGEPGVGKTAIVEGIARRIAAKDVPGRLRSKRVLSLDLGGLISGTKYRGEFEARMKKLTDEIRDMGRIVILFIDEVHMIEQAKGAEGAINVSDILKPALSRGELQTIGATTWKEYEAYIKPDDALNRRFQPVMIGEPSDAAALQILRGIKDAYEEYHGVMYEDDALRAAVTLSKQYIKERFLPDKAIDLIDEAGAKVSIEASHNTKHAMGLLHAAGASMKGKQAALTRERAEIAVELARVSKLEQELPEPEISEIRKRFQHLVIQVDLLSKRIAESLVGKIPVVRVKDIQDVVKEWTRKR